MADKKLKLNVINKDYDNIYSNKKRIYYGNYYIDIDMDFERIKMSKYMSELTIYGNVIKEVYNLDIINELATIIFVKHFTSLNESFEQATKNVPDHEKFLTELALLNKLREIGIYELIFSEIGSDMDKFAEELKKEVEKIEQAKWAKPFEVQEHK